MMNLLFTAGPNKSKVKSNWPQEYTRSFASFLDLEGRIPAIRQAGIKELEDNRLWIQILDEKGSEVLAYNTAASLPKHYSPSDFLVLSQSESGPKEIVCANTVTANQRQWIYLMGFPMNIKKVTMFVNGESFTGGKSIVIMLTSSAALLMLLTSGVFGIWVIRQMKKMTQAIGQISHRQYEPIREKGMFQDIYDCLNQMNRQLLKGDQEAAQNEIMREEWITNITHDLKTPLSPIRGYAELLSDPDHPLTDVKRIQYGQIILRNAAYAEKLVNDLKLTYQLKNHMLPVDKKHRDMVRFLKELIIEIRNHQEYTHRVITFRTEQEEVNFYFDELLLKRALNNLILNALIHNPKDTNIHISLETGRRILLTIQDNGKGMTAAETSQLFERYYRGTNTESASEGTGLGMAIAKQIIENHQGSLAVTSEPGNGTQIWIDFPFPD